MPFDYVEVYVGNDERYYTAPYHAQIPLKLRFQITTTYTNVMYLKWTLYWYEHTSTGWARRNKTMTIQYSVGTRTFNQTIGLAASEIDFRNYMTQSGYPRLTVELLSSNDTVLESLTHQFKIIGQTGATNWTYNVPAPSYSAQYPVIGTSTSVSTMMTDFASTSSGSPLAWREAYNKIGADNWAKLMLIRGTAAPIDIDVAASAGYRYIPNTWSINSDVSIGQQAYKLPFLYYAYLYLTGGFLRAGDYKLVMAYYEKNGTEMAGHYTLRTMESPQFRIYTPFTGAGLHITSVVPSVYKEGDTNPLNGKPPFTVTVADDTVRDEYTVPLEYITIDWDDPQSDVPSWTISNPGSDPFTIPPHVYNDSRTHNIQMICKDGNGNITTAEVKFSPSQEPRIISRPKLNNVLPGGTITAAYPALMSGEAFNAGSPAPTTEWTYSLQSDPGYYSGTRTGDYVEFSLLAQGRYTVTATIKNENITLGTYSWTVNVGAEDVSTAADKQMPDYALIVLDAAGQPLDYCKQHTCPQYAENFQSLDTVSFELPADYTYADRLKEGDYFLFGMGAARLMQVAYRAQKGKTLTITGECVFPQRVAIYATRSTAADGYDVQTCSAEALIRYFVHTALSDPYNSQPRSADFWMHGTNQDLPTNGAQVTYSARYENILDIINSVCKTSGIGYSIAVRDVSGAPTSVQMTVKEGVNRTYATGGTGAVIFSEKLKNCLIDSDQSAVSSNVAIGAGAGVGYIREYSYYDKDGNTNPPMTGFNRREVFVDAGDSADDSEQKRMSVYQLREEQALSISLQVLPTCQWVYGTDYAVGDTVSVWLDSRGGLVDLQIYSADHVKRESGEELHLHLGSRVQTAPALIASNERKNTYARK